VKVSSTLSNDSNSGAPAGLRILLVESHSLVGAALSGLLCGPPLGAAVEIVLDGETAMARLEGADFDLVVCELSVPPKNTMDFMTKLASHSRDVPVVLLSDAEEEQLLLDALTSGATGFFTKDCPPDEFIDGVRSVLEGHYAVGRGLMPGMVARVAGARKVASSR
jgi:DNA-binding NarL/FixJ family response regulator